MAACPNENSVFTGRKKSMKGQFADVTSKAYYRYHIMGLTTKKQRCVYWNNEYRQILHIHL